MEQRIRRSFDYAFEPPLAQHAGGVPKLDFHRSASSRLRCSERGWCRCACSTGLDVLGFRFGNVAYCTDTNGIPEETWRRWRAWTC